MNYPAAELRGIKMNFYLINPDAEHRGILLIKKYLFVFYQGMSEFIAQKFQTTVGDLSFSAFFFFLSVNRSNFTKACPPMNDFLCFSKSESLSITRDGKIRSIKSL
jgi:hypothetical protein